MATKAQTKTQPPAKPSRDRKIHIDFRPAPRPVDSETKRNLAYFLITLVLLFNVGWYVWKWIQPWDRSAQIERLFAKADSEDIPSMTLELLSLGEPGRATLLSALANPRSEVRQSARILWWRTVTEWRENPTRQPADVAKLFNDLPHVLENVAPEEREQLRNLVDQWLELKLPQTKATHALENKSREHLLDLTRRPPLRGLQAAQLAMKNEQDAIVQAQFQQPAPQSIEPDVKNSPQVPQNTTNDHFAQSNTPRLLQSDTRSAQPLPIPQLHSPAPQTNPNDTGSDAENQSELGGIHQTPLLRVAQLTPELQIGTQRTRDALDAQLNADWSQIRKVLGDPRFIQSLQSASEQRMFHIREELRSHGWNRNDLELLDAFASRDHELVKKTIDELPERIDIKASDWLRGFALHPAPAVRRAAYSWLVTSRGLEIKQWLAERVNAEQDGPTREWLSAALESGERRATGSSSVRR